MYGQFKEKSNLLLYPVMEMRFSNRPACNVCTLQTELCLRLFVLYFIVVLFLEVFLRLLKEHAV
jgi:hypothetical protein